MNFSNMPKNLEKLTDSEKTSKRKTSQSGNECPTTLIDNNSLKSTILKLNLLTKKYDFYESPKYSTKPIGPLKSYSHNSFRGLFKDYNEDKNMAENFLFRNF